VPTLAELLKPAAERVAGFYRGNPSYDAAELGWKYRDASETHGSRTRLLFRYETRTSTAPDARAIPGNSNAGHLFTVADDAKRHDLLEYLKSL
jgi:hypothetical protein